MRQGISTTHNRSSLTVTPSQAEPLDICFLVYLYKFYAHNKLLWHIRPSSGELFTSVLEALFQNKAIKN